MQFYLDNQAEAIIGRHKFSQFGELDGFSVASVLPLLSKFPSGSVLPIPITPLFSVPVASVPSVFSIVAVSVVLSPVKISVVVSVASPFVSVLVVASIASIGSSPLVSIEFSIVVSSGPLLPVSIESLLVVSIIQVSGVVVLSIVPVVSPALVVPVVPPALVAPGTVVLPTWPVALRPPVLSVPPLVLQLVFGVGDIEVLCLSGSDIDVLLKSDPAEEIDLERDLVLDESLEAIPDGDDVALLDDLCDITLEEGFGGSGLVSENAVDHGDLEALFGVDNPGFCGQDLDVDVESASVGLKVLHLDEFGFNQLSFLSHIC